MKFYKITDNGYIMAIGEGRGPEPITESEYNAIMAAIQSRPECPEGYGLRLRADTLEYETFELPPEPEVTENE